MSSNIPHSFIYFNDSENIIFAYAVSFSLFRIFICICIHLPTCLALWCVIFTSPFVSLLALYSQHLYFVSSSKILSIQRYIWIDFFRFVAAFCLLSIVCGVYANFSQWPHYFYPMQYTCMHLSSFFFPSLFSPLHLRSLSHIIWISCTLLLSFVRKSHKFSRSKLLQTILRCTTKCKSRS